MTHSYEVIAP